MSTSFGWEGKDRYGHNVSGWTRRVQVKLWDPLRTRAIPERLEVCSRRGAIYKCMFTFTFTCTNTKVCTASLSTPFVRIFSGSGHHQSSLLLFTVSNYTVGACRLSSPGRLAVWLMKYDTTGRTVYMQTITHLGTDAVSALWKDYTPWPTKTRRSTLHRKSVKSHRIFAVSSRFNRE